MIKSNIRVNRIISQEGKIEIVLLEEYEYENKIELYSRERYWIEKTENCINKQLPGRTREEYLITTEYYKKYHQRNKEYLNEKYKQYYHSKKNLIKT